MVGITVEDQASIAAFDSYTPPIAEGATAAAPKAAAAAPVAAPPPTPPPAAVVAPAAPVARPAPTPAPAAAPAATPAVAPVPKPTAAAAPPAPVGESYTPLSFEAWGASIARAPISQAIARQQAAYTAAFGYSGHDALPVAETSKSK